MRAEEEPLLKLLILLLIEATWFSAHTRRLPYTSCSVHRVRWDGSLGRCRHLAVRGVRSQAPQRSGGCCEE